jgi:hypothetical protein
MFPVHNSLQAPVVACACVIQPELALQRTCTCGHAPLAVCALLHCVHLAPTTASPCNAIPDLNLHLLRILRLLGYVPKPLPAQRPT